MLTALLNRSPGVSPGTSGGGNGLIYPHCTQFPFDKANPECYCFFVTEEYKDAIVGRVVREKREAEHNLALLQSETKRITEKMCELCSMIRENPLSIIFEGEPYTSAIGPAVESMFSPKDLDFAVIKNLVTELKSAIRKSEEKNRELEKLLR